MMPQQQNYGPPPLPPTFPSAGPQKTRIFMPLLAAVAIIISLVAIAMSTAALTRQPQVRTDAVTTTVVTPKPGPYANETPEAAKKALCEGALVDAVSTAAREGTPGAVNPTKMLAIWAAMMQALDLHPNAPENLQTAIRQYTDAVLAGDHAAQVRYGDEYNRLCK